MYLWFCLELLLSLHRPARGDPIRQWTVTLETKVPYNLGLIKKIKLQYDTPIAQQSPSDPPRPPSNPIFKIIEDGSPWVYS